ncbi:MAG TPA: chemotaxis protein CheR [Planctomycetaceae bacterium]|nr:chemotaxis protein CheR [Planctomycetaceae bacterium]
MSMATSVGTTDKAFDYISKMILDASAIVLDANKAYLVESRLAPILRAHDFSTLADLVEELKKVSARALRQEVIEAMTTNETSFFRDIHPFEALKKQVLPDILKKRSSERTLRIWSNACSSGQEPYTIAMILRENFPELAGWKVKLIGSDLDTKILGKARSGIFNQTEVNRGLPMQLLLKYFERDGLHWRIKEEIRSMVEFKQVNLVEPFPVSMGKLDIIFLRNVLIYFSVEMKQEILSKARRMLHNDGYLFLGGGESVLNLAVDFEREQIGKANCYRPV